MQLSTNRPSGIKTVLEYLRDLELRRATGVRDASETSDPQVKVSFGRGHKIGGPSATLEEVLAAPTISVPEKERRFHPGYEYIFKEPLEPSIELTQDGIIDSGVYVRRKIEPPTPPSIPKLSVPAEPKAPAAVEGELTDGSTKETPALESTAYGDQKSSHASGNSIQATLEPIAIPPAVKPPKRPVGRPPVWSSEAERKAYERQIKREQREMEAAEERRNRDTVSLTETENEVAVTMGIKKPTTKPKAKEDSPSVLDAYPPIRKGRGGKTSGISKNLLVKRVLEQNELCIYCDRRFGSLVLIDAKIVSLEAQPDHFQPVADRKNDNPSNIHAADQICNERIKGSRKFASLEEARTVIQAVWTERGWKDAPPLMPFLRTTDPVIYGHPN